MIPAMLLTTQAAGQVPRACSERPIGEPRLRMFRM